MAVGKWDYCLKEDPFSDEPWNENYPKVRVKVREFIDMHLYAENKLDVFDSERLDKLLDEHFTINNQDLSSGDKVRKFRDVLCGTEHFFKSREHNRELLGMSNRMALTSKEW